MVTGALARASVAPYGVLTATTVQTGVHPQTLVHIFRALWTSEPCMWTVAREGCHVSDAVLAIGAEVALARVVMPTAARDDVGARAQASVWAAAIVETGLTEAGVCYAFTLWTWTKTKNLNDQLTTLDKKCHKIQLLALKYLSSDHAPLLFICKVLSLSTASLHLAGTVFSHYKQKHTSKRCSSTYLQIF